MLIRDDMKRLLDTNKYQDKTIEQPIMDQSMLMQTTKDELINFNKLLEDSTFMSSSVNCLHVIGGKNVYDMVRRILRTIMSNDLALKYNWMGRGDRSGFKDFTNIVSLIIATARKNPLCMNATKHEVETVIKSWLRNAGDRNGGRIRRGIIANKANLSSVSKENVP